MADKDPVGGAPVALHTDEAGAATEVAARVELGALDPARDAARWQALASSVARRALAERRRSGTLAAQLRAWGRPALAAAAALAALAWGGALLAPAPTTAGATTLEPAAALSTWASEDRVPAAASILTTLGGSADATR